MDTVTIVLVFLLAVVVCGFLNKLLPFNVPAPLLQIAVGASMSYFLDFEVVLNPALFLMLFIPPLLFLDGWRIPKGAFFRDWKPILALAIGLVIFTVVGLGLLIGWMIPAIPLAVAFALAAILSPTDPVAVAGMTASSPLPSRLMHILEGESLLNDATGLVCFTFAVAAAVTGVFSLSETSLGFIRVAGGGLIVGLAVTWAIARLNRLLVKRTGEEPGIQIMISLLIPFAAYLAAEHFHFSGILAAAVAGIGMHYSELSGRPLPATRMQRNAVWDTMQTALNGIIFVLLGDQLPRILRSLPEVAAEVGIDDGWVLAGYVVVITVALGVLRFLWVWLAAWAYVTVNRLRGGTKRMPSARILAVTATAGVRGAITLAGILTLPLALPDGSDFPGRDAAIFLAMGVILLSLLIASVGLPLLSRGLADSAKSHVAAGGEHQARTAAAEAAIRRIEQIVAEAAEHEDDVRAEVAVHLLDVYRRRLEYGDPSGEDAESVQRFAEADRKLRKEALRAERDELYRLRNAREIDDDLLRRLVNEIDLVETSLTRSAAH